VFDAPREEASCQLGGDVEGFELPRDSEDEDWMEG